MRARCGSQTGTARSLGAKSLHRGDVRLYVQRMIGYVDLMKSLVFLSWSGPRARAVAEGLNRWIPRTAIGSPVVLSKGD